MINCEKYRLIKDEEIIRQIVVQNQNNLFEVLYDRYATKVNDKAFGMLKNVEQAREAVQVIFIRAFEGLSSFRAEASFSSWLYAITYNYCIDYLRHQKQLHYPDWNTKNELPEIIDEKHEDVSGFNEEILLGLMEQIHPEEKALLVMKYIDDISIREISKALRVSESAAKMRLKRARARLLFLYQEKVRKNEV